MKAATWKKVQRMAYAYYYLIFAHIMILYVPKLPYLIEKRPERLPKYIFGIVFYSIIYISYTVLKLRKDSFGRKKKGK